MPEVNAIGANFLRVLALLLAVAWPVASHAEADGPDFYRIKGVAAEDTLAIRSAPSARAAKVGDIPPDGTCIRNLGAARGA